MDGTLLFDRKTEGRFPETKELKQLIRDVVDPDQKTKYDKRIKMVPRAFRDHMPDFYLQPLMELYNKEYGVTKDASDISSCPTDEALSLSGDVVTKKAAPKKRSLFGRLFRRKGKATRTQ